MHGLFINFICLPLVTPAHKIVYVFLLWASDGGLLMDTGLADDPKSDDFDGSFLICLSP